MSEQKFATDWQRTHRCADLHPAMVGREVVLNGWLQRIRHHGKIHFLDLRDASGLLQVVVDADVSPPLHADAAQLRMECCLSLRGRVRARPDDMVNSQMASGAIEVLAERFTVLGDCPTLPFMINDVDASSLLRQKHRYLALRGDKLQRQMRLRHRLRRSFATFLEQHAFVEIETPTMIASTPEGARDYLVPSRQHPGSFYALPQSPQIYKQLLMVAGFERYYQIARCYRDEDSRGDRQPEFTQLDLEMSFCTQQDVLSLSEAMVRQAVRDCLGEDAAEGLEHFPRLTFHQAMNDYGSDKPDLRYPLLLQDATSLAAELDFQAFRQAVDAGGVVKVLAAEVPVGVFSRKRIGALEETAQRAGASGLAWCKVSPDGNPSGGIAKFLTPVQHRLSRYLPSAPKAQHETLLLFVADRWELACQALGAVRQTLAQELGLLNPGKLAFAWVVDFPLFEKDEESGGHQPKHHMFTSPREQDLPLLADAPERVLGQLYDLVLNGHELGSGSIRIHQPHLQHRIFQLIGLSEQQAQQRFGFLLEALRYGAPPHGGIALGLDRMAMIFCGCSSIRDVIAFPKNNTGASPMDGSPSPVAEEQLHELALRIVPQDRPHA